MYFFLATVHDGCPQYASMTAVVRCKTRYSWNFMKAFSTAGLSSVYLPDRLQFDFCSLVPDLLCLQKLFRQNLRGSSRMEQTGGSFVTQG